MALYGDDRDRSFIKGINDELLRNIIEQEVLYYKINVEYTPSNMYGESLEKFYNEPVLTNPLVVRADQENSTQVYGPDDNRYNEFRFFTEHLIEAKLYCEKGDILEWQNEFYEVDSIIENQYFMGKSGRTSVDPNTYHYGDSISVRVFAKLVRPDKLNIVNVR